MKYCATVSLDQVLKTQDLFKVFAAADDEQVSEARMQEAINQMRALEISMGQEIKPVDQIKIEILRRVVQVQGELYEYSPLEDQYIPRVKNVFLSVDQTGQFAFMLNVLDLAQKVSYTRKEIKNVSDF